MEVLSDMDSMHGWEHDPENINVVEFGRKSILENVRGINFFCNWQSSNNYLI